MLTFNQNLRVVGLDWNESKFATIYMEKFLPYFARKYRPLISEKLLWHSMIDRNPDISNDTQTCNVVSTFRNFAAEKQVSWSHTRRAGIPLSHNKSMSTCRLNFSSASISEMADTRKCGGSQLWSDL
jgi:hypothetical protein